MLGGIDPIIIFHLYKAADVDALADTEIPLVSKAKTFITMPAIPIYLSETLTGLYIQAEDRDITIQTSTESPAESSTDNEVNQKAAGSMINIEMVARKDSIGLTLLSAMCDIVLPKVTTKEYAITYLHGATTVFLGLLEGFTVTQNKDNDLVNVKIKLSKANAKGKPQKKAVEVDPVADAANLETGVENIAPTAPTKPALKGPPPGSKPAISNTLG